MTDPTRSTSLQPPCPSTYPIPSDPLPPVKPPSPSPLNIIILGASFAGLSCAHHILDTTLPQLRTTSSAPEYRVILISPSTNIYWNIGAPRALVAPNLIATGDAFIPIEPGLHRHHASTATTPPTPPSSSCRAMPSRSIPPRARGHFPFRRRVRHAKHVILIAGGPRLLPRLKEDVEAKAEKLLLGLGVEVRYGVRVRRATTLFCEGAAGGAGAAVGTTTTTRVDLDDGAVLMADAYLACTGVKPNSGFLPPGLKDDNGYVNTHSETLRVEGAGERVYAVGDVGSYSQNHVLDVYAAVPVAMHNLLNDLLKYQLYLASPYGGNEDRVADLQDITYTQTPIESQLCPITRFAGAGMILNKTLPKFMIFLLKGHDYRVCKAKKVVVDGGNPYAVKTKYE